MSSRGVNKVILVGSVGQDPETRYMPNGGAVTNFSIATSEVWKDKNSGEKQARTEWHRCVAYQRLAEIIAEYVRKGSKLYVEGKLQTRSWEQDGQKRYVTEIIVSEMQLLDSKKDGGQPESAPPVRSQTSASDYRNARNGVAPMPPMDYFYEDLPF